MNKIIKQILILSCLVMVLILPYFVFAATQINSGSGALGKLKLVAEGEGGYNLATETTFAQMLGLVVNAFLSLLGIIFVGLIIYAGYNWMTATGESEKIETAKKTTGRSITGLIITLSAYAIWIYVSGKIFT